MNLSQRVWLIGGTQESAELASAIAQTNLPCIVSVTTAAAKQLYRSLPGKTSDDELFQVWVGRLTSEAIAPFLEQHRIGVILDASHPYAVEISQLAIATAAFWNIPYLRFERPTLQPDSAQTFESFETLLASNLLLGQRSLLIVGYRPLALFQPWHERATLFARLLPSTTAIEAAIAAGFSTDRLFAMRPPISAELEKALWQHWQISLVISKASGKAGGEDTKRQVAAELGIPLVTIARPPLTYPQQTSDLNTALDFCAASLQG